jgi:hypothetical protein
MKAWIVARWHCWLRGHDWHWARNIYGDEINRVSLFRVYRSWWMCLHCGAWQAREKLQPIVTFDEASS